MTPAYPQWSGFPLPFPRSRTPRNAAGAEVPDHHSQLEELFSHVRRCEKWAQLDDRIDLDWKLQGKS
jgi:hypothetical protein